MKAVAKTVERPSAMCASTTSGRSISRPDVGRAAAPPPARRHQGRIRSARPRRHQFGAGAAAVQYRRQGTDRRRAAHARLLSRLQRLLQSQEARRDGFPRPPAFARRSPLGAHQAHRKGREVRDIVEALYQKHVRRWSRSAASTPTSSRRSTSRCIGSSASGPTRFSTASKSKRGGITCPGLAAGALFFALRHPRYCGPTAVHMPVLGGWRPICYLRT